VDSELPLFPIVRSQSIANSHVLGQLIIVFVALVLSIKLKAFAKFEDTNQALKAASSLCEGTLDKSLKKFLKKAIGDDLKVGTCCWPKRMCAQHSCRLEQARRCRHQARWSDQG